VVGDEDFLQVAEGLAVELRAGERRRRQAVLAPFGVCEVEPLALREPRMQRTLEEPAEDLCAHGGHPGNRRRIERSVTDDSEFAASFGDERIAVRQEREAPRMR